MTSIRSPEIELRSLIAELTRADAGSIDLGARLDHQGLDSLQLIILRERVEASLAVVFSDEEWNALDTPARVLARVASQTGGLEAPGQHRMEAQLEIGMPLTGRNHLAETPLLQYLGDQRWRHISDLVGVPSREIVDDAGDRLYATFYYADVAFPIGRPMSSFGENDRFTVVSTLSRYGTSMVDGISYLVPFGVGPNVAHGPVGAAVAAGVPAVRLSNIFVKQFEGAQWLKKGRPAHEAFSRIPALAEPPDSYAATKEAERLGAFDAPGRDWRRLTEAPVERHYHLVPDRDLNGAGLVYFANYPMFLDICERDVLAGAAVPLPDSIIDRRTVVRRRSAYLNNAAANDILRIETDPCARLTERGLELLVNARMFRRSDGRLMMVSTAHKIVPAGDIADFSRWSAAFDARLAAPRRA
jgi:probable biosynthetic protein (TIGR04098 family)